MTAMAAGITRSPSSTRRARSRRRRSPSRRTTRRRCSARLSLRSARASGLSPGGSGRARSTACSASPPTRPGLAGKLQDLRGRLELANFDITFVPGTLLVTAANNSLPPVPFSMDQGNGTPAFSFTGPGAREPPCQGVRRGRPANWQRWRPHREGQPPASDPRRERQPARPAHQLQLELHRSLPHPRDPLPLRCPPIPSWPGVGPAIHASIGVTREKQRRGCPHRVRA